MWLKRTPRPDGWKVVHLHPWPDVLLQALAASVCALPKFHMDYQDLSAIGDMSGESQAEVVLFRLVDA